ncbi:putative uncharacterized crustin 7-like [Homarus americanus]|uniref:Uncharacterized crustin 7-like n=1 Tax=Homarus americanus TaxID=6706 RepID=A0A8J5KNN2_HOMAM|nr:putative uncharacterized crustin 7-like [Homarus americanus]
MPRRWSCSAALYAPPVVELTCPVAGGRVHLPCMPRRWSCSPTLYAPPWSCSPALYAPPPIMITCPVCPTGGVVLTCPVCPAGALYACCSPALYAPPVVVLTCPMRSLWLLVVVVALVAGDKDSDAGNNNAAQKVDSGSDTAGQTRSSTGNSGARSGPGDARILGLNNVIGIGQALLVCTHNRSLGPPSPCKSDFVCSGADKCCFDKCLQEKVCKAPSGFGR